MNADQANDSYTIVIFRGPTAKPLRLSCPRHVVRKALIIGMVLLLADLAVISHYVIRTNEVWELQSVRTDLLNTRQQVAAFSVAFEGLQNRVLSIKEMNQRMRVMLGIDVGQPEGDLLHGRGGAETPIDHGPGGDPSAGPVQAVPPVVQSLSDGLQSGVGVLPVAVGDSEAGDLERRVRRDIAWLNSAVTFQEQATEKLMEEAEKRKDRWNATPSIWPVKGWVTSGFGPRISPFTGRPALHDGLDIGASSKTPVRAPAHGRVTAIGFNSKLGYIVRVDHGYGIQTLYGHLAKYLVKNGQRIKRGDVVGLVGSTGLSTGPHLHYMVQVRGRAVNPRQYILE